MAVDLQNELDKAYASQIQGLFNVFVDKVAAASDKEAALAAGAEQFKAGVTLVGRVLAKAKQSI
jgi:hypothetical protein